jgi:queuine/archaeosine tRNA-ribosyltransferase
MSTNTDSYQFDLGGLIEEALGSNREYLTRDPSKLKFECICPTCQQKHKMIIHWIGRGTPRKFCQR